MKRFLEWIEAKQKLDEREYHPPYTAEGDFWWCAIGENIGIEVAGKHERFTRPVIILKKFGRFGFLAIPTTTRDRRGSWYVSFTYRGIHETALLSQARFISYKRLDKKMGVLSATEFKKIKDAYMRLFSE